MSQQSWAIDGLAKIAWARRFMAMTRKAIEELGTIQDGYVGLAMPLDAALASLALVLKESGFAVSLLAEHVPVACGDLLVALRDAGVTVCESREAFSAQEFDLVFDHDGSAISECKSRVSAGAICNLISAGSEPCLHVPVIDLLAAPFMQSNVLSHGIGQSCVSGFLDITNLQIAGSHTLVIGYDPIGQGVAQFAKAYGARVIVCESDLLCATKAKLEGHQVLPLEEALPLAKVVFHASASGPRLSMAQIEQLPDGAFVSSAAQSHDAYLIANLPEAVPGKAIRDHVSQHQLPSGRCIKLVCNGMPIHSNNGLGLPFECADVLMAAIVRSIVHLSSTDHALTPGLHPLPAQIECDLAQSPMQP